jgi:phosphoribosylamine-glycine ligase
MRVFFVVAMSESVEQLKRKVASLMKESEELRRFRKDIDWLKTLQKKVVKDQFD